MFTHRALTVNNYPHTKTTVIPASGAAQRCNACGNDGGVNQRGNMLFIILLAVALIGALSAAIMSSNNAETSNIDSENMAIKASEVQRYASELERAVLFIMQNGHSESDIRFSHADAHTDYDDLSADTDTTDQVFARDGGGATYRAPPSGINDGSAWEFYGGTHLPGVGSNRADLIAVLPNVTAQFCDKMNALNNQTGTPTDTGGAGASGPSPGDCLNIGTLGRFSASQQFYASANTVDETTFEQDPETSAARTALQACVTCQLDSQRHFYHVLMAR